MHSHIRGVGFYCHGVKMMGLESGFGFFLTSSMAIVLCLTACGKSLPDAAQNAATQQIVPLSVVPTSASLDSNKTLQLLVTNGVKPYRFSIVSGGGSVSLEGLYTPPAANQITKILVADQKNGSVEVTITSQAPDPQPTLSAPNPSVVDATTASSCAAGFSDKGAFAAGRLCLVPAVAQSTSVIADIYVTPEGAHIYSGPGCKAGYAQIGSFADCGGGTCYGNQQVCASRVSVTANMPAGSYVKDAYFAGWGGHTVGGPKCNTGYTLVGSGADCSSPVFNGIGFVSCYGNVVLCVAK